MVRVSGAFDIRVEWLDAPGVTTPELAATWARYEVWATGRCVTQVEESDGTLRRSVYGSLYPLAEWIASNWWTLSSHTRPSAVDNSYWTWPNARTYPWLVQHNFRAAGDGMPWPNLTLVAEGAVTNVTWVADSDHVENSPIRFASAGTVFVPTDAVMEGLARFVARVLERLSEEHLRKTRLAEEWDAIAAADHEEQDFCRTVAQLGLDPYSIGDDLASQVVDVASSLPDELRVDFFDSADPTQLGAAASWTERALAASSEVSESAEKGINSLHKTTSHIADRTDPSGVTSYRPWMTGYEMARRVRAELGIDARNSFDVRPWVAVAKVRGRSSGVQGVASVHDHRCGLVLGQPSVGSSVDRFGRARTLGRALLRPGEHQFVLSEAHGHDEKLARAFAAELLAPADGIRAKLNELGKADDAALDVVARHFGVSSLLVKHQYDNQIARTSRS